MSVALPLKTLETLSRIAEPDDWAAYVRHRIGNDMPELMLNYVLCAVYIANENLAEVKTQSGVVVPILKAPDAIKEDVWQGKIKLVLACGPAVCVDDQSMSFYGKKIQPGDWVSYPNHTCYPAEVKGIPCQRVQDRFIIDRWRDPRHLTS